MIERKIAWIDSYGTNLMYAEAHMEDLDGDYFHVNFSTDGDIQIRPNAHDWLDLEADTLIEIVSLARRLAAANDYLEARKERA